MHFGVRQYARQALSSPIEVARELIDQISRDRVGGLSAEIAFFALLSFFPTMIMLAALLGSVDAVIGQSAAQEAEDWLVEQMVRIFGGDNTLESTVNDLFESSSAGALTIGAVLAIYAATRGFIAVVRALDIAYDHEQARGWFSTRLVGFGITLTSVIAAAVVMVALVVGPLFGEGERLSETLGVDAHYVTVWSWLRWPVVFLVMTGWAATVYHVAPNHRAPWRIEYPGALLASVWWSVVSVGFSTYLNIVSSGANVVFGFLGGALSLLFWLYLMAMGLLVGAEVNSLLAIRFGIPLERTDDDKSRWWRRVRSTDDGIQGAS
ncbi:MAG: YihY/virulence factor BrkB family protein [Acidimicrobiaceae bacterium]|nr:YihY/virulence factor BrkB family protein [Acidimicrobiaceae bacterium]MDE0608221.1 YihY/virulence factor BrkB family protein [Acidimicrobiaceae bacterium]